MTDLPTPLVRAADDAQAQPGGQEPNRRSVSQFNQYAKCPKSYKLARIDNVWQRPAAWLPQGTAFHAVLEAVEKGLHEGRDVTLEKALALFDREYAKDINALTAITPNFEWWSASGPYRGREDVERRWAIGREQIEKFFSWRFDKGQTIWITPDHKPAVELNFDMILGEDPSCPVHVHGLKDDDCECGHRVRVVGFIDVVVEVGGELLIRDYKTGNTPGDDFQLGVYALAIRKKYGVEVWSGDYYMAGKKGKPGKPTAPYDLSEWTEEAVTARFAELEENIQAGRFDPDPEPSKCAFCDVSYSCEDQAG